ncbi:MAG: hypothetical protein ACK55X_03645 [Synechococcaceae cyanobacterium]|jgi:hypothetical protein
MSSSPRRDARAQVDAIVQSHQLQYSLVQLRVVGILLLLLVASRCLEAALSIQGPPIQKLSAISALSNWLPLLPLGISLYLLGGGRRRQRWEFLPTELLHRCVLPFALVCLVLLPWFTLHDVVRLNQQRRLALQEEQARISRQAEWLAIAERTPSSAQIQTLALRNGVNVPIQAGEPVELSRWRFSRAVDVAQQQVRRSSPLLSLSPWEQEVLSLPRAASTVVLQVITGIGLLVLHRQGSREIHRHGLNPSLFFRTDPVRKRRLSY